MRIKIREMDVALKFQNYFTTKSRTIPSSFRACLSTCKALETLTDMVMHSCGFPLTRQRANPQKEEHGTRELTDSDNKQEGG